MSEVKQKLFTLIREEKCDEALDYYHEHIKEIPFLEREIIFRHIYGAKTGTGTFGGAATILFVAVIFHLFFARYIKYYSMDMLFSGLSSNLYFHYYKQFVIPAIDLLLLILAIGNYAIYKHYSKLMGGETVLINNKIILVISTVFLSIFILVQGIPLALDLSYVMNNKYEERYFSSQERRYTIDLNDEFEMKGFQNSIFADELEERAKGIKEFHHDYQRKPWLEPYNKKIAFVMSVSLYKVWVSDVDYLIMGQGQYRNIDEDVLDSEAHLDENHAIRIKYLPHSRTVLEVKEEED